MLKSFAKSFAKKKGYFREIFAGSHVETLAALAIKKPYSIWTFRTTPKYKDKSMNLGLIFRHTHDFQNLATPFPQCPDLHFSLLFDAVAIMSERTFQDLNFRDIQLQRLTGWLLSRC